jgi:hypothetical protein
MWANIYLDSNNWTLAVVSDCGNFSYCWGHEEGETFKHFLSTLHVDYLLEKISKERYTTHQWNFRGYPVYSVNKSRRIEHVGTLNLTMDINDNVIARCSVFGDYFGDGDSSDLTRLLIGNPLNRKKLLLSLSSIDIDYYFHNLSKDDFIDIILN